MNTTKHVLTADQKRLVDREIKRQVHEISEEHFRDTLATFLYGLHMYTGWGKKKLYDFWKQFDELHKELLEYYKFGNEEDGWLCKTKLKQIGVDIEEWIRKDEEDDK